MQNARENPLSAAAVAAAVAGGKAPAVGGNVENLLDIDFDGAVPASALKSPGVGMSGLEGLAGTPQRVNSPMTPNGGLSAAPSNNMDDLMGLGDMSGMESGGGFGQGNQDMLSDFASLDMSGSTQPPPAAQQLSLAGNGDGAQKKTNEDLLGLF